MLTKEQLFRLCDEHGIFYNEDVYKRELYDEDTNTTTTVETEGVFLHWPNPNDPKDQECCFLEWDALQYPWETIYRFVVNGRDVKHFTRIVGYNSEVKNWNASKVAERRARLRGDYKVE